MFGLLLSAHLAAAGVEGIQPVLPESAKVQMDTVRKTQSETATVRGSGGDTMRHRVPSDSAGFVRAPRQVRTGTAVLLSTLIPGAGQFYTGNPLKGVIIGSAELALAGISIAEYRRGNSDLGNTFLWWTGFALGFSMADAYVSASMYGFKEEERLTVRAGPLGMEVAYRF